MSSASIFLLALQTMVLLTLVSGTPTLREAQIFLRPCIEAHGPGGPDEVVFTPYKEDYKNIINCCNYWKLLQCVRDRESSGPEFKGLGSQMRKEFAFFAPYCQKFQDIPCPATEVSNVLGGTQNENTNF